MRLMKHRNVRNTKTNILCSPFSMWGWFLERSELLHCEVVIATFCIWVAKLKNNNSEMKRNCWRSFMRGWQDKNKKERERDFVNSRNDWSGISQYTFANSHEQSWEIIMKRWLILLKHDIIGGFISILDKFQWAVLKYCLKLKFYNIAQSRQFTPIDCTPLLNL